MAREITHRTVDGPYTITYGNGRVDGGYETYEAAVAEVERQYPDGEIGHDGDLSDGGDRTLFWASEEDSIDDDGARAAGSIRSETRDNQEPRA